MKDKVKTQVEIMGFYLRKLFESNDITNFSKKLLVNFCIMLAISGIFEFEINKIILY